MAKNHGVTAEICMVLDRVFGGDLMVYRALLADISPKINMELAH